MVSGLKVERVEAERADRSLVYLKGGLRAIQLFKPTYVERRE